MSEENRLEPVVIEDREAVLNEKQMMINELSEKNNRLQEQLKMSADDIRHLSDDNMVGTRSLQEHKKEIDRLKDALRNILKI